MYRGYTEKNNLSAVDREQILKDFEHFRDKAEKAQFYSTQRIDLIIISISSGAILITANSFDLIAESNRCQKAIFYLSVVLYVLAIISNILGQINAERAHAEDARWARKEIRIINGQLSADKSHKSQADLYNDLTIFFDKISLWAMMLGLIISLISFATFLG